MLGGGEAKEYDAQYVSLLRLNTSPKSDFNRQKVSDEGLFGMLYFF
jgi:hypothetical protein